MEKPKAVKDDWIKMQSKSRPGRFYLFNRSTGETQWLSPGKGSKVDPDTAEKKPKCESPPRILAAKALKTPAQDRLKRLQHEIKINGSKKQANISARRSKLEIKSKKFSDSREQQENVSYEQPTTSRNTKSKDKLSAKSLSSPAKPSKRPSVSEGEVKSKLAKTSIVKETKQPIVAPLSTPIRASSEDIFMASCSKSHTSQNPSATPGTGILSKLKEVFKFPFSSLKSQSCTIGIAKKTPKNTLSAKTSPVVLTALSELRSEQKKIENQNILNKSLEIHASRNSTPTSSVVLEALNELKSQKEKFANQRECRKSLETTEGTSTPLSSSPVLEALNELRNQQTKLESKRENKKSLATSTPNLSLCTTPKNLPIPNYQRGSANSRLDRLRQSLILQQTSASANPSTSLPITVPTTPTTSSATTFNIPTNSLYLTANNSIDDEVEAMDWQPVEKEDIVELSSSKSDTSILPQNKFEKNTTANTIKTKSAETMGDIYDAVSENLLRLSAEKKPDKERNSKKWLKDFYYFVVDTNVLLEYLSFLEDLSRLKLCDTNGTVLYIPYGVLQELDKLKMRSGRQEGVKTLAVRAIKYLNKKFENNILNLQAQTAIEERQHIIEVSSADDSIINCCLQAKEHVPNLVLLTEDVNLRNKAICNMILVTTKSDLMCKRFGKTNESSL